MNVLMICGVYFLAVATPGPSQVFVIERSLFHSKSEARWGALGVSLGSFLWLLLIIGGLQGLLAHAPEAKVYVRHASALLLTYFVFRNLRLLWRDRHGASATAIRPRNFQQQSFFQGALVNLLNPNSVVFYVTLFAPLISEHNQREVVFLSALGIMLISLFWYQMLAEVARTERIYTFLKRQSVPIRVVITLFYIYWGINLYR